MKNEESGANAKMKNEESGGKNSSKISSLSLRGSSTEAIKPSELIQISGHQSLTLISRRAITILWHNAHTQGIEEGRDYTIELASLRTDGHKGDIAEIEDAVISLMQTVLTIRLPGNRIRRVQFLGGNDMLDPERPAGTLTYSFDKRLVEILEDSTIWGKIAIPVLMAFSSKYVVSLYENACQWSGLKYKLTQDFTIKELRDLLGVEDSKYTQFGDLNIHVLKPAVREINALAPFNVTILPVKTGRRVTSVKLGWWRKSQKELDEAWREAQRPKVGRKARISGTVVSVSPPIPSQATMGRKTRLVIQKQGEDDLLSDS